MKPLTRDQIERIADANPEGAAAMLQSLYDRIRLDERVGDESPYYLGLSLADTDRKFIAGLPSKLNPGQLMVVRRKLKTYWAEIAKLAASQPVPKSVIEDLDARDSAQLMLARDLKISATFGSW